MVNSSAPNRQSSRSGSRDALGGVSAMLFSVPVNDAFWNSELPAELGKVLLYAIGATLLVVAATKLTRLGVPKRVRTVFAVLLAIVLYMVVISLLRDVTADIESQADFVGGLGVEQMSNRGGFSYT